MRGEKERQRYTAAIIVDSQGITQYYIVPSRMVILGVATIILLLLVSVTLGLLVAFTKSDVEAMKDKIETEDSRDK